MTRPLVKNAVTSALAVAAVLAALVAALVVPVMPSQELEVKLAWAPGVSDEAKTAAAREFGLTLIEVRDDGVWLAEAGDTSDEAMRRIVQDPRVRDTDNIDRREFALMTGPEQSLPDWLASRSPDAEAFVGRYVRDALRPSRLPMLGLLWVVLAGLVTFARTGVPAWVARGIPGVSPAALGIFRTVYGAAMTAAVAQIDITPLALDQQRQNDWIARTSFIRDLSVAANGFEIVHGVALVALVLFTLGMATRASLAVAAFALLIVDGLMLTQKSIHDWGIPTVTLFLMLVVPWHQAAGFDSSWRRWRNRPDPATAVPRGLAVWIPGFTIGVAFLAAAYAKLDVSGLAWITDGAVRYHFITDSVNAPVTWGLQIAASDTLAVASSLGAVVVEALFIAVVFLRQPALRLLFGLAAAALLTGFYLFQGVVWPAWWALLLAFLPWPWLERLLARVPHHTILIDGDCPLCRRTARVLHSIDWLDRLTFADASNDQQRARLAPGLDRDRALAEMFVLDETGHMTSGYDGYIALSASVPLLWLSRPIGLLPPVAVLGRAIYARIAAARTRIGRCTDETCDVTAAPLPLARPALRQASVPRLAVVLLFGSVLAQQVIVSTMRFESEPLISNFPMYSRSWPSRAAFDEHVLEATRRYTVAADDVPSQELETRLAAIPGGSSAMAAVIDAAVARESWSDGQRAEVGAVLSAYEHRYGARLDVIRVLKQEQSFDWGTGAFDPPRVVPQAAIDPRSGTPLSAP